MRLDLQTVKDITIGAVRVTQEENGFHFYRFTSWQQELYKIRSEDFYKKTFSTSGIQLSFKTDSKNLFLSISVSSGSSRKYFAVEVFVNGKKLDTLNNFSNIDLPKNYIGISVPLGEFEKDFALGSGTKEVCVCLPWSVQTTIQELCLDDGSFVEPIKPKYKLLCFGDSITQGYDALFPSNKYASQLAKLLNAQEYNKGIGGEIFFPELVAEKEDFLPDYISVAYGTNDWNRCTEEEFRHNCGAFFQSLHRHYPQTKIFVITPIWRKDFEEERAFGAFDKVEKILRSVVENYDNVKVISGFAFVDPNINLFADLRLHPNDKGFQQYFGNLAGKITD